VPFDRRSYPRGQISRYCSHEADGIRSTLTPSRRSSTRPPGCWPRSRAWILVRAGRSVGPPRRMEQPPLTRRQEGEVVNAHALELVRVVLDSQASSSTRRSNFRSGCAPGLKDSCCRADAATGPRGRCETSIDAGSSPTAARALIAPFTPESVRTAVWAGAARSAAEVSMMRSSRQ
jgi:hypothetical protein